MKLSVAILRGCSLRDGQFKDSLFGKGCSCVLGAAYEGIFGRITPMEEKLFETKGWIGFSEYYSRICAVFPCLQEDDKVLMFDLITMNLTRTREEIAQWLSQKGL